MVAEGAWLQFVNTAVYKRKKEADRGSYFWDDLLQRTTQNALDGTLMGNADIYNSHSAIFEMAKEPRFIRRHLCERISAAIRSFPYDRGGMVRHLCFCPSIYDDKAYVFLQVHVPDELRGDYDTDYRPLRRAMLEVACGAARNKFAHVNQVIGIAIDAPRYRRTNSEDFILMDGPWTEETRATYDEANRELRFFETSELKRGIAHVSEFPRPPNVPIPRIRIGRNERCPCGSGRKFKKCHGSG
jgi:hypothetical protein